MEILCINVHNCSLEEQIGMTPDVQCLSAYQCTTRDALLMMMKILCLPYAAGGACKDSNCNAGCGKLLRPGTVGGKDTVYNQNLFKHL